MGFFDCAGKDGVLRFCMDYWPLNAHATWDAYPLPRIEDFLAVLSHARYFLTLVWILAGPRLPHEDQEKTDFVTPMGLYEFL